MSYFLHVSMTQCDTKLQSCSKPHNSFHALHTIRELVGIGWYWLGVLVSPLTTCQKTILFQAGLEPAKEGPQNWSQEPILLNRTRNSTSDNQHLYQVILLGELVLGGPLSVVKVLLTLPRLRQVPYWSIHRKILSDTHMEICSLYGLFDFSEIFTGHD